MNTAIVMLGSNIDQNSNLVRAKKRLADFFEILDESATLITEPIGKKYTTKFHNVAIKLISDDSANEVARLFKQIENEMGRSALTSQKAEVPIDIDLIFWNNVQRRSDYDKFPFVRQCVDEIKDRVAFID